MQFAVYHTGELTGTALEATKDVMKMSDKVMEDQWTT